MRTIHKFEIKIGSFCLSLEKEAKVLTVATQNGRPYMWVLRDTEKECIERRFHLFGTGDQIPKELELEFLGTFLLDEDMFVFHLFEEKTNES